LRGTIAILVHFFFVQTTGYLLHKVATNTWQQLSIFRMHLLLVFIFAVRTENISK